MGQLLQLNILHCMEVHQDFTTSGPQKISFMTQSRLIDSFNQQKIPDFYQNLFISYIKNVEPMEAEICMREEIQSLSNSTTYIQSYLKHSAEKEKYESFARLLMGYNKQSQQTQDQRLLKLCQVVLYLRDVNYKCSYFLLKIRMKYEENVHINQSTEKYYYNSFAIKLDSFRKELLKSLLSKFVQFKPEYDPFFMNIKLKDSHKDRRCNEAIQMLMQFTVEDSYKYLKIKKVLNDWIYMHSKTKMIDKTLDRIDLPGLKQSQQYVEYDRLKEELLREKLRDRVAQKTRPQIKRNNMSLNNMQREIFNNKNISTDVEKTHKKIESIRGQLDIVSLEKIDYQIREKLKHQRRMEYLNQNIYEMLDHNAESPQTSSKFKLRVKSQAFDYGTESSPFVGRIKRLKSLTKPIQSSPITFESKRSQTLPILNKQDRITYKAPDFVIKNKSSNQCLYPIRYYDKSSNHKEQRPGHKNSQRIKLQKLSAFEISIIPENHHSKKQEMNRNVPSNLLNSNQAAQNTVTSKSQEQRSRLQSTIINPKIFSTLKSPESIDLKQANKREQTKLEVKTSKQNNVKNEYLSSSKNQNQQKKEFLAQSPILIDNKISQSQDKKQQKLQSTINQKQPDKFSKPVQPQKKEIHQKTVVLQNKQSLRSSKIPQKPMQMKNTTNNESYDESKKQTNLNTSNQPSQIILNQNKLKNNDNEGSKQIKKQNAIDKQQKPVSGKNLVQNNNEQTNKTIKQSNFLAKDKFVNEEQRLPNKRQAQTKNSIKIYQKKDQPTKSITKSKPVQEKTQNKQKQVSQIKLKNPQNTVLKQSQIKNVSQQSKQVRQKTQEKKEIKMKVGKFTLQTFRQYLKNYKIHRDQQKNYDIQQLSKEMQVQQTYVTEFSMNGQPCALAIIYLTSNSKLVLRLWALQKSQDINLSLPLFKKFIDFVQKLSTDNFLYYKRVELPQLASMGFVNKKDDIFERKRTTEPRQIRQQFQQCFAVQCSQIKFVHKQKEEILVSAEIQNFTLENSLISSYLFTMVDEQIPQKVKALIKVTKNIASFKILNTILQQQDCDSYQSNSKIIVENINLSLFNFLSDFRDIFVASEGFIKFYGNLVKQAEDKIICSIRLSKNNGRICFAKGYKTAKEVANELRQQMPKKAQFWVPMFNKKLYGRFKNYKPANEDCYANWDITISWQDEMQGALKYLQRQGINFGESTFFVSIQLEGNQLYIFEVNQNDYIF